MLLMAAVKFGALCCWLLDGSFSVSFFAHDRPLQAQIIPIDMEHGPPISTGLNIEPIQLSKCKAQGSGCIP